MNDTKKSDGCFPKIIWATLVVFCVVMSIYECTTIFIAYFQYPTLHQRQHVYTTSLAFPAVTLCSNNPANRLLFAKNSVGEKILYFQNNAAMNRQYLLKEEPRLALLDALYNMTEAERLNASTSWTSLKLACSFGHQNCFKRWYMSNTLFYGNCFTFNHVTNPDEGLEANDIIDLTFGFFNELVERIPNLDRKPNFLLLIHPVGTAPVLHRSQIIAVAPGDELIISVTQSILTRLPHPYKSQCVDSRQLDVKNTTVYYRPDKEYLYSVEACLMTCIQQIRMELCKCVDPYIPVASFLKEKYGENLPLCIIKAGVASCYFEHINESHCDCPVPCKETKLALDIYSSTIAAEDSITDRYNAQLLLRMPLQKYNYTDKLRGIDPERTLRSYVNVRFKSTSYEKISELPKLTASDFLGFVGGNIGLWLGMSVLSFFDIAKYFLRKCDRFWRRLQQNIFPKASVKSVSVKTIKRVHF